MLPRFAEVWLSLPASKRDLHTPVELIGGGIGSYSTYLGSPAEDIFLLSTEDRSQGIEGDLSTTSIDLSIALIDRKRNELTSVLQSLTENEKGYHSQFIERVEILGEEGFLYRTHLYRDSSGNPSETKLYLQLDSETILLNPDSPFASYIDTLGETIVFETFEDSRQALKTFTITSLADIPEPNSLALLSIGGLLAARRRRV